MVEDLSTHHSLIGNLFDKPRTTEEWAEFRLSDEQVQFYREQGYRHARSINSSYRVTS